MGGGGGTGCRSNFVNWVMIGLPRPVQSNWCLLWSQHIMDEIFSMYG